MTKALIPREQSQLLFAGIQEIMNPEERELLEALPRYLSGKIADSSRHTYLLDMKAYVIYAFATHAGKWLDPATFRDWSAYLINDTRKSPNTINRHIASIKRCMVALDYHDRIDAETLRKFNRVTGCEKGTHTDRERTTKHTKIEPEDMRRICALPDRSTLLGKRDAALLAALVGSGLRANEAASIEQGRIYSQNYKKRSKDEHGNEKEVQAIGYYVEVKTKTSKGDYERANLTPEAYLLIADWLQAKPVSSQYVFISFKGRKQIPQKDHMTNVAVLNVFKKYATQAGFDTATTHDTRRYVGTQLALTEENPRKAQKVLRHKSIETTMKYYVLDDIELGATDSIY